MKIEKEKKRCRNMNEKMLKNDFLRRKKFVERWFKYCRIQVYYINTT